MLSEFTEDTILGSVKNNIQRQVKDKEREEGLERLKTRGEEKY